MTPEKTGDFILVHRPPTVGEYLRFREVVGWGDVEAQATKVGLEDSLFSVCVVHRNETIGCGRVVGDGGIYFYIQDIIVLPEYQGRGIGKRIMDAVMEYLREHAVPGSFIGLMAATGVSGFYERYGFVTRPTDRPGMFRMWREQDSKGGKKDE